MKIDYEKSAEILRAMAHPVRLGLLMSLIEGPRCVKSIGDLVETSQPNLSQHLNILKNKGIIAFSRNGKQHCYYIVCPDLIKTLLAFLRCTSGKRNK